MSFLDNLRGLILQEPSAGKACFSAACGSNVGKKRKNNEDNYYFDGSFMNSDNNGTPQILTKDGTNFEVAMNKGSFYAVFDGMGGGEYGEVAAFTAAEETHRFFENEKAIDPHDVTISLQRYCNRANEKVVEAGYNLGVENMGSTLAGLYFYDGCAWACNLGDSRCFLYRNGDLWQISEDHTDALEMERNGITGRKPYLTQYLGVDPKDLQLVPHVESYSVMEGDIFLACTDGLTDMVSEKKIASILEECATPESAVEELIRKALAAGGRDNVTVIVCRF